MLVLLLSAFAIVWLAASYLINGNNNAVATKQYSMICDKSFLLDEKNKQKFLVLEDKIQSKKNNKIRLTLVESRNDENNDLMLIPIGRTERLFINIIYLKIDGKKYLYFRDVILKNKEFLSGPLDDGYTWRSCFGEEKDERINAVVNSF